MGLLDNPETRAKVAAATITAEKKRKGIKECMQLTIDLTTFYSNGDEWRFFHGLSANPAVSGCRGIARQLEITIVQRRLNHDALRDLIALFRRYRIPLSPLAILADKRRFEWLKVETAYWYESMFLKV